MGSTEVTLRAIYTGDSVFFRASWADPTNSFLRSPWVKQDEGSWAKIGDPNDRGGENNLYYEDKLAFNWSIGNCIPNFEAQGCFTACDKFHILPMTGGASTPRIAPLTSIRAGLRLVQAGRATRKENA